MITPHHILYNLALLDGKPKANKRTYTAAIALGAFFPDAFTYVFFLIYGVILGLPHERMWDDLYFNSPWNAVFSLAHSLWLLPLLAGVFFYLKYRKGMYFFISATIHALTDLFVHADDAYRHFYPFSNFIFHSPISYYDSRFYGNYVNIFSHILAIVALYVLYKKAKAENKKSTGRYIRWFRDP